MLSAAERGPGAGDSADGFFDRIALAGGGELYLAFAAVQRGMAACQTGDGLVDGTAGSLLRDDTVAGAAVEGRTGADLAVDGFIDDRTLVIAIQTHTLLLVFFIQRSCCVITL